jgi:hypothetical protein
MTFAAWHAEVPDLPGWASAELFRYADPELQQDCWDDLGERCRLRIASELDYERRAVEEWPRKRRTPHHGTAANTSTGTERVELSTGDPLKSIPAATYLPALTGELVSSNGRTRCPRPDHPDERPSAKCYGTRWYCFSCGAGGSIIDAAAAIYGLDPTGRGWFEVRRRLLADLGITRAT